MSKARITIIELDGLDVDSEFGLMRTLRDLLERSGQTVIATTTREAEAAPGPAKPAPVIDGEFPEVGEPAPAAPVAARRRRQRTQEEIEDMIVESLKLEPAIDLQVLASAAYGADDKRARTKLTWTLKGLAGRGLVERLSATTWRATEGEPELLTNEDDADDTESNGHSDDDAEELDLS